MFITDQERMKQDIATWSERFGRLRSSLLPLLQEIQRKYRCISDVAMQVVADNLGIHPVEVHSVVSFYSFLDERPRGRFIVRLCRTISCDLAGRQRVAQQLMRDLGIQFGETTPDGNFTLEWANCLGMCDQGPALLVNDEVYTKVTPAVVHEIIECCRRTFSIYAQTVREVHA
jgi:NADH:ubiquinone oxidoreductase subunit E